MASLVIVDPARRLAHAERKRVGRGPLPFPRVEAAELGLQPPPHDAERIVIVAYQ